MAEIKDRLAWARAEAGYENASDAARSMGMSVQTYLAHENGSRGLRRDSAQRYAQKFRVSLAWLLTGKGVPRDGASRLIPVVGHVGAGAEIFGLDDAIKGGGLDEIEAPPGAGPNAIAVKVRGDSMLPAYHDGDVIIYDERREGASIGEFTGRECVVRVEDGRTFIKSLAGGSRPGLWTLWSYNAAPMHDVALEWAARVRWIERA